MAYAGPLSAVLGLLLASALLGVLGERPSPHLGAHAERPSQGGPGATGAAEPRRRPPPKEQRERARAGALSLGALYTAAVVAFVLYKCLQGKDEAAAVQEKNRKSLQSEQQLAQLTQQLAQTEQHLSSLVAQLDPLFERVTTLVGAQRELLNMKLQTIHQLLQDCKPDKDMEVPEPEASLPFPEDLRKEEVDQEAGNSQTWAKPIHCSPGTWSLGSSWEVEQVLRRRCGKAGTNASAVKEGQLRV
uniref:coiled-coil domain-containing protein 107 n=1 Tax=Jaculus jaculus TaxID=51337 RepID=UPI001E1B04EC|nr:coiled-coil domain-containing protein 107 [Jaculus jaculus]